MRPKFLLTGVIQVSMVIRKKSRPEAAKAFMAKFPEATLMEVTEEGARYSTVDAVCDACEEPIFSDQRNVGVNDSDLHEWCRCTEEEETTEA